MRRIMMIVTMLGITIGMVGVPQISHAASFSYPEAKVNIELVNKQGDLYTKPLNMSATYVTADYNSSPPYPWNMRQNSPLAISKVGGENVFEFTLPGIDETTVSGYNEFFQFATDIKMTTPVSTVTSMQIHSVPSYKQSIRYNFLPWSSFGRENALMISAHNFTKNGDGTWNMLFDSSSIYSFPQYKTSSFLTRWVNYNNPSNISTTLNGIDGDIIRVQLNGPQIKEIFEDEAGTTIPAPSGYINDNYIDVIDQPQSYQMVNDSSLPKTYTDSGFIYTYKGWYKGAGNQGSIVTTHPPSIGFSAGLIDAQNEVHIVYNKRAIRTVDEEYVDTSSGTIESSWNNMGQQKADGDVLTQTPAAIKTDSSGADWEYQGWKLGTEPMSAMRPKSTPVSVLIDGDKTIQYVYKKKQHTITTKLVDATDGVTLVPKSGNISNTLRDDNSHFWGYPTATITDDNSGIWDFVGWENVTDTPGTINPSTTSQILSIKGDKEIRYHYQARNTTATLDLNPTPKVINSGGNVSWSSRLTNTGSSTLNNLSLKATSNWASGLSEPTQVTVTPGGGAPQTFTLSPGDWTGGFNLTGITIPITSPNNYADITFSTTATGAVNQVLPAEIELDGNMANSLKAENFVRIDDPDEPNLVPSGNAGLINIPDFRFGEVEVKPYAQTKGLDTSAYQSGYDPYIRFMDNESTGGWSLSVKLDQFTSGSKTLPATTTIKLRNGVLMEVQDYNKSSESLGYVDLAGSTSIPSDSTTVALTNGTNQGVYHLEYGINNVELELMAHSGIAGLSYQATMDWTLTTAP